ncbi:hypothetical protein FKP32DRAFT_5150 [Trametes sanguinea]|nr:hypothetical protein FKP32DRAFT_5150 [Trametes sanguinea]
MGEGGECWRERRPATRRKDIITCTARRPSPNKSDARCSLLRFRCASSSSPGQCHLVHYFDSLQRPPRPRHDPCASTNLCGVLEMLKGIDIPLLCCSFVGSGIPPWSGLRQASGFFPYGCAARRSASVTVVSESKAPEESHRLEAEGSKRMMLNISYDLHMSRKLVLKNVMQLYHAYEQVSVDALAVCLQLGLCRA